MDSQALVELHLVVLGLNNQPQAPQGQKADWLELKLPLEVTRQGSQLARCVETLLKRQASRHEAQTPRQPEARERQSCLHLPRKPESGAVAEVTYPGLPERAYSAGAREPIQPIRRNRLGYFYIFL